MKVKIWRYAPTRWAVAYPGIDKEVEVALCRTWDLAMIQARWVLQHPRSA